MKKIMYEVYSQVEYLSKEKIMKVLAEKAMAGIVIQYVFCLHDKDQYTEEDEKQGKGKAGDFKDPHWHIFIKLNTQRESSEVANWFGLEEQYIQKIIARTFDKGCLYATHANAPEKYQYNAEEAVANFDYKGLVEAAKTKAVREKNQDKLYKRKMEIVNMIDQGVINKFNLSTFITAEEEVNFNSAIKIAFDRRQRYLESLTERDLTCIYISGNSGASKSSLAVMICQKLGLSYIQLNGGSTDPFQPYRGQEAIILNDIDFNTFGWKEFLNLTDNNNASLAKARYKDIALICKVLIITTTKDPFELVQNIAGAEGEEKKQFYRRFTLFYKLSYKTIKEYHYNPAEGVSKYELVKEIDNIALTVMKEKGKRKQDKGIKIDLVDTIQGYAEKNGIIVLDTTKYDKQEKKEEPEKVATPEKEDLFSLLKFTEEDVNSGGFFD